jgi:site-specific recombinase XerD
MKKVKIGYEDVSQFGIFLAGEERSAATVEKYRRDAGAFVDFLGSREISRQIVLDYKKQLSGRYAPSSANSMIAALNSFLRFCGQGELCVKRLRVQRAAFCSEKKELTREEYCRLVRTAEKNGNDRLGGCAILC